MSDAPPQTVPTNDAAQRTFPTMASGNATTPNRKTLAPGDAEGPMEREDRGAATAAEPLAARQPPNRTAPAAGRAGRAPTAALARSGAQTAALRLPHAHPGSKRWVRFCAPRLAPHRPLPRPPVLQPQRHRPRTQLLIPPLLLRPRMGKAPPTATPNKTPRTHSSPSRRRRRLRRTRPQTKHTMVWPVRRKRTQQPQHHRRPQMGRRRRVRLAPIPSST